MFDVDSRHFDCRFEVCFESTPASSDPVVERWLDITAMSDF